MPWNPYGTLWGNSTTATASAAIVFASIAYIADFLRHERWRITGEQLFNSLSRWLFLVRFIPCVLIMYKEYQVPIVFFRTNARLSRNKHSFWTKSARTQLKDSSDISANFKLLFPCLWFNLKIKFDNGRDFFVYETGSINISQLPELDIRWKYEISLN